MADGITFKFNLPDFSRQLRELGEDFERKTVRAATAAAAGVFKKEAIKAAPILRSRSARRVAGTLKRAMYLYRSRQSTRGKEHYIVSFRKGARAAKTGRDAFYGRFLEEGWIPRGPGNKLRGGRRTRALARARGAANKITAYKFIGPAFQAGKEAALRAFTTRIETRLEKENAKRLIR